MRLVAVVDETRASCHEFMENRGAVIENSLTKTAKVTTMKDDDDDDDGDDDDDEGRRR